MDELLAQIDGKLNADPIDDFFKASDQKIRDWDKNDPNPQQTAGMRQAREAVVKRGGGDSRIDQMFRGVGVDSNVQLPVLNLRPRDLALPFQDTAQAIRRGITGERSPQQLLKAAEDAFSEGKATDDQLARLAAREYEENRTEKIGPLGRIAQNVAVAPAVIAESIVGGAAVKAGGKALGLGRAVEGATTGLGRVAQAAGTQAVATPITPTLWLREAEERQAKNGGYLLDPKNAGLPMFRAAMTNAIMGHTGVAGAGKTFLKRAATGGAVMPTEQAGADVIAGAAEDLLVEAGMPEKFKTETGYGTIGMIARGQLGPALEKIVTESIFGGVASFAGGGKADPVESVAKALNHLKEKGATDQQAAEILQRAQITPPEAIRDDVVKSFAEAVKSPQEPISAPEPPPESPKPARPAPEVALDATPAPGTPTAAPEAATGRETAVRLQPAQEGGKRIDGQNLARHDITDADGKKTGEIKLYRSGDTLNVEWMGSEGAGATDKAAKGSMGPTAVKDTYRQLADLYPDAILVKATRAYGRARAGDAEYVDLTQYRDTAKPAKGLGRTTKAETPDPLADFDKDQLTALAKTLGFKTLKQAEEAGSLGLIRSMLVQADPPSGKLYKNAPAESPLMKEIFAETPPKPQPEPLAQQEATNAAAKQDFGKPKMMWADEPDAEPSKPAKPPYEMSPSELDDAIAKQKKYDAEIDVMILGEETAKRYKSLQRKRESMNEEVANKAEAEIEAIEGALSEKNRNILYGIGETGPSLEELRDYKKALSSLDFETEDGMAHSLKYTLTKLPHEGNDPAAMTHDQRVAFYALQEAISHATEKGWDLSRMGDIAVRAAASRFHDPADAEYVLKRFIVDKPPTAPPPPQPARLGNPAPQRQQAIGMGRRSAAPEPAPAPEVGQVRPEQGTVGNATEVAVPGAKAVPGRYEVRELRSVIASDTPGESGGFRRREEYPAGLQPRSYTGNPAEIEKVRRFASEMQTAQYLSDDPNATGGPPTITKDNVVINGNGRQMSLEESARTGTYAKYKADLVRKAAQFGIDPKAVEGMKEPVLYRVVDMAPDSLEAKEFARRGNLSTTQGQSAIRTAASLGNLIDNTVLDSLRLEGDTTFAEAVNDPTQGKAFRKRLQSELPPSEVVKYFNEDGSLNDSGKEFVRGMLLSKILPVDTIEKMQAEMKAEARSIEGAIPQLLQLTKNERINPTAGLVEAVGVLARNPKIKSQVDADNMLSQKSLFGGNVESISPDGRMILDFVLKDGQKPLVFRKKLGQLVTDAEQATRGLFAEAAGPFDPSEAASRILGVTKRDGAKFRPKDENPARVSEVNESDLNAQATQMLQDAMANRVLKQGPGTAAKANFGSDPAKAEKAGRTFVQMAKDFYNNFGGHVAPQITRAAPESADKLARHTAADSFAAEYAPLVIDKILNTERLQSKRLVIGSMLTEMRLRYMRKAYLKQAADAATPELSQEYTEAAQKVKSIVGQPVDGDVLRNPLGSEADFQHYLADPDFNEAVTRYREHLVPFIEEQYRKAEGLDAAEAIPAFTQIPGLPMNLMRWKPDTGGEGVVSVGSEPATAMHGLNRAKLAKLGFAKRATGSGEGYHLDLTDIIHNSIIGSYGLATKADMIRQFTTDGLAKFSRPGRSNAPEGYEYEVPNVTPPKGTQLAKEGHTSLFFKDKGHADEVIRALDVGRKFNPVPFSGGINLMILRSLGEVTAHTSNLLTMMVKPGMKFTDLFKNVGGILKNDLATRERIVELTKMGAMKPKGFESQMEGETWAGKIDPLKYTGKFLDVVDRAIRLSAADAFSRKTKAFPKLDRSEGALRDFVNQLGNYNKRTQPYVVKMFRELGIGPFATAGTNYHIQGLKALFGGHGFRTNDRRTDFALRAQMIGRMAAFLAVVPLANYLKWGRADGDDNTPIGAVKVGEDEEGNSQYFDMAALIGLTRGMRETGLRAIVEGNRPAAREAGANAGTILDSAGHDAIMAVVHPFAGPLVSTALTVGTGNDTIGRKIAKDAPKGESQTKYNLIAAAIHANPIVAAMIELGLAKGIGIEDPLHRKTTTFKEVMKQLGRYGVKSSKFPPGKPFRVKTIPAR